jgi:hypothetical protein
VIGPVLAALLLAALPALPPAGAPARGTCHRCHLALEGELRAPAEAFAHDVHAQRGLGCVACHGGDANAESPEVSMDPARGFVGRPAVADVPRLCGRCHADARLVRRFAPTLPTDQLAQYVTSHHHDALTAGDTRAAVCTSCHGAHGIRSAADPASPVHPTNVVGTCARCHARPDQEDPVDGYERSVHHESLTVRNNLAAPTCDDCHGSHGATPPASDSVSNVCGHCHARNMELFRESPHDQAFRDAGLGACGPCHGNHAILHPDSSWVGLDERAVCGDCHVADTRPAETAAAMRAALDGAHAAHRTASEQVAAARNAGMLMTSADVLLLEAHEDLLHARTLVHALDPSRVEAHTSAAVLAAERALDGARDAFVEIRYRRTGLLVAVLAILVAITALLLQIRRLEQARRGGRGEG